MIPGKLRAPMATPKRLPSQNFPSLTAGGAASPPGGAHRRPHMYSIISCISRWTPGISPAGPRGIMPIIPRGRAGGV